jgi:hypothetical protein
MRRATTPNLVLAKVAGTLRVPSAVKIACPGFRIPGLRHGEAAAWWLVVFAHFGIVGGCSKATGQSAVASDSSVALSERGDGIPRIQILPPDKTTGELSVQRIDLGSVGQGETLRRTIIIENRTSNPITIDRFDSSCDCLKFRAVPISIGVGANARLQASVDERNDSSFHGALRVQVTAYAAAAAALKFDVCLSIRGADWGCGARVTKN